MKNFKRGKSKKVVENIKKQKQLDLKKKAVAKNYSNSAAAVKSEKKDAVAKNYSNSAAVAPIVSDSSDSEVSDSSDSEYEEILISNLSKSKNKEDMITKNLENKTVEVSNVSDRQSGKALPDNSNHSNHFTAAESERFFATETKLMSEPILKDSSQKPKKKSKKVVIKKYYNYKPKVEPIPKDSSQKQQQQQQPRLNYLGFHTNTHKSDTRKHITDRIFNW